MAKIKEVRVNAIYLRTGSVIGQLGYYWNWLNFKTFTDDNGNSTYYINNEEVSKEDGNKRYLYIKQSNADWRKTEDCKKYLKRTKTKNVNDTFQQTVTEREVSYEELIQELEESVDKYTEYIDNPRQQREAEEANVKIYKKIAWLKQLIKERKA